jgi:hypothetical protein
VQGPQIVGALEAAGRKEFDLVFLDLAMPALRQLGNEQREKLLSGMQTLVQADGKNSIFKLAIRKAVENRLWAAEKITPPDLDLAGQGPLSEQMLCVLSALAMVGHRKPDAAEAAFNAALRERGGRYAGSRFRRARLTLVSRALGYARRNRKSGAFSEAREPACCMRAGVRPAEAVLCGSAFPSVLFICVRKRIAA